jgi:hypothetical protein
MTNDDELYRAIYHAAEGVIVDERGITGLGLSDDVAEAVETVVLGFFGSDRIRERVKTALQVAQDSDGNLLYQIPPGVAGTYADAIVRALTEQAYPRLDSRA